MHYWSLERKLWWWQDSTVWKRWDNVVKFYQKPDFQEVLRYHQLQTRVSELVRDELNGELRLPWNFAWNKQAVRRTNFWVLRLPDSSVYQTFDEVLWEPAENSLKRCPEWYGYKCISVLPYVQGDTLPFEQESSDTILSALTSELRMLDVALDDKNIVSAANVKVRSFHNWELSLMITDIGASIMMLLERSKVTQ